MRKKAQPYKENGVIISKESPKVGDFVTLYYSGILYDCGADTIYAHAGYGDDWYDREFLYMDAEDGLFKVDFEIKHPGILNVCFKDGANNWDNNSNNNYTFNIKR